MLEIEPSAFFAFLPPPTNKSECTVKIAAWLTAPSSCSLHYAASGGCKF